MHAGARQGVANGFQGRVEFGALLAIDTYLDELMGFEVEVDFFENGRSQALVADHDDGMQRVGGGAQSAALLGCNVEFGHSGIVREWPRKNSQKTGSSSTSTIRM